MQTSRAVVLTEFDQPLTIEELRMPAVIEGAAMVSIEYGGICGTDVHLQRGGLPVPTPLVLGHEGVGRIEELGEGRLDDYFGTPLQEGDRVVWASNIPCGACFYCVQVGERTLCQARLVYGINQPLTDWPGLSGSWADAIYLQPRTTIIRIPDEIPSEDVIALGCAGPTAVHGMNYVCEVRPGDLVVIQGAGPVGLAAGIYAKLQGASMVIMLGAPSNRLSLARTLDIADVSIDIANVPLQERTSMVLELTNGRGADLVVEATGAPSAVAEGIDMCRPNGQYLVLGQYTDHGSTPINPHLITRKQLRVLGSWAFSERHYADYMRTLPEVRKRHNLSALVSVFPLTSANDALAEVAAGGCLKAVLAPLAED